MDIYEIAFKMCMGDYTSRTCRDVWRSVYVGSNDRKLTKQDADLLDEIYKRSGGERKNPFIFGNKNMVMGPVDIKMFR